MQREPGPSSRRHGLLALLAAAAAIAACGGQPHSPRSDAEFIDEMIPHHEDAVAMTAEVLARGESDDVRRIAERMRVDQLAEIEHLREMRSELDSSTASKPKSMDARMKADMDALRGLSGDQLDDRFLRDMIAHHAGAVMMSHRARPNLESSQTREMADTAFVKQTREMNEMVELLAE